MLAELIAFGQASTEMMISTKLNRWQPLTFPVVFDVGFMGQ